MWGLKPEFYGFQEVVNESPETACEIPCVYILDIRVESYQILKEVYTKTITRGKVRIRFWSSTQGCGFL